MPSLDFPASPINGQTYTANGATWTYDLAKDRWFVTNFTNAPTGPMGYTGSQGVIGFTGSASTVIGFTGSFGFTGSQGDIGYTGSRGDTGFTGSQGIPGEFAALGYTGSRGFTGSQSLGLQSDIFYENTQTILANYTINSGKNAVTAGPVTIAPGVTVTVPVGSSWSIV